jgi:hypothetical protein
MGGNRADVTVRGLLVESRFYDSYPVCSVIEGPLSEYGYLTGTLAEADNCDRMEGE